MMRIARERLVTVTHLPFKAVPIALLPYPVEYMLTWGFIAAIVKLNSIHFVLLSLL
jgi:hypothetical protein